MKASGVPNLREDVLRIEACVGVVVYAVAVVAQPTAPEPRRLVRAVAESSLSTADGTIRQFAFDGDPMSAFASVGHTTAGDHLNLIIDAPVAQCAAARDTGRAESMGKLPASSWEVSADGTTFEHAGLVTRGHGAVQANGPVWTCRLRLTRDLTHPLIVREFTIDSTPKVIVFRHPIKLTFDATDAHEMKAWDDKVARISERSPGYLRLPGERLVHSADSTADDVQGRL
jgi:hypothetical protein